MKPLSFAFAGVLAAASAMAQPASAAGTAPRSAAASTSPTRQAIGDWLVTCTPPNTKHRSCMMSQTLSSRTLKKTVSVLAIGKDRAGKLKASIRLPVGVALPAGVTVSIEHQKQFTVPYSACHRIGCFAPFDLTDTMLGQMGKTPTVSVVARSVSEQALTLNFSTRGFPAAYETFLRESR